MTVKTPPEDIYSRCGQLFCQRVSALLQNFFEVVDNSLFALAEKAESNALQNHFFDGMRQVRKTRGQLESRFNEVAQKNLQDFRAGRANPVSPGASPDHITEDDMSLIDESELEQNLAVSEMVAKGENRLSRPLYALNQRLGASLRIAPPGNFHNPMGPAQICAAMQEATAGIQVELPVLIVIYKLFDKQIVEQLGPIYDEVNNAFIKAGILPQLRARSAAPAGAAEAAPAGATAQPSETEPAGQGAADAMPPAAPTAPPAETHGNLQNQVFSTILDLLAARRGPPPAVPGAVVDQRDLLNALSILQAQRPAPEAGNNIKNQLLTEVSRLTDDESAGTAAADEDSIDLVAMLFEFILADRNLPAAIQVVLSRLQIPYIKVALLDAKLFANRNHPARQLLDDLADVGVGWSAKTDRGKKLLGKMENIVECVVTEFDDDIAMFTPLRDELRDFIDKNQRRAKVAEKRTTEATEGQQRLQTARRKAAETLDAQLDGMKLPSLISEILGKPWANVLVLTYLRHGPESAQYEEASQFINDLIWTSEPKTTADDVARLQGMLPELSAVLRGGLEMVAYHEDEIRRIFKSLKQLYRSMVETQYRDQLSLPADAERPPPVATMDLAEAVLPVKLPISGAADLDADVFEDLEELPPEIPLETLEAALVEQVRALETNSWFEFTTETGDKLRAKLSWKSPITGNYLFVDQKGLKVADKPMAELVQELARGETVALEAVPLFDRALVAISGRLSEPAGDEPVQESSP